MKEIRDEIFNTHPYTLLAVGIVIGCFLGFAAAAILFNLEIIQ